MTSAPSIPSINACLDSLPHPTLPPIEGLPTYKSLSAIKELLKANAASVHTMGSRGNHGYLGLILSAPVYNMITPGTFFVIPNNPGLIPLIMGALQHKLLAQQEPTAMEGVHQCTQSPQKTTGQCH